MSKSILVLAMAVCGLAFGAQGKVQQPATPAKRDIRAMRAEALSNIISLEMAMEQLHIDTGRYPTRAEGLACLLRKPSAMKGWTGPYVTKLPIDPWNHAYVYDVTKGGQISVVCYGADGKKGGKGDAADISRVMK
jgi:general secretion pathway protein G